jgi:hypothetical protein
MSNEHAIVWHRDCIVRSWMTTLRSEAPVGCRPNYLDDPRAEHFDECRAESFGDIIETLRENPLAMATLTFMLGYSIGSGGSAAVLRHLEKVLVGIAQLSVTTAIRSLERKT